VTETGDYRFLNGNIIGERFHLSTFDGSHAFLFEGEIKGDELTGKFFSGTHWVEPFEGKRDANASIGDPYKLTYLKEGAADFDWSFADALTGDIRSFKEYEGKPMLLQIFGSWCPNCMDESVLYSDLYDRYKSEGFEIVAVAFERSEELDDKTTNLLKKYKEHFGIDYPILFGGKASKKVAAEKFPMLNHVMSFPTSIVTDKNGNVRKIHTGFNGPATEGYSDFVNELESFIQELIRE
ncbi:TlpA family protein disulfide reductase, partial [Chitinophagales bacterium]|nr:TlpA family protein disulfide reductase [Chitinophagales bacterium]